MAYPAQVQRRLEAEAPGRYQVLNVACPGAGLAWIKGYFRRSLLRFEPDILTIYPAPVLSLGSTATRSKQEENPDLEKKPRESLRILRKVRLVLRRAIPRWMSVPWRRSQHERFLARVASRHEPGWVWQEVPPVAVNHFRTHLAALIEEVQGAGVQMVLMTHANGFSERRSREDKMLILGWRRYFPRASEACLFGIEAEGNRIIHELGRRYRVPVVDIDAILEKGAKNFADPVHFTNRGAGQVAAALVKEILRQAPGSP